MVRLGTTNNLVDWFSRSRIYTNTRLPSQVRWFNYNGYACKSRSVKKLELSFSLLMRLSTFANKYFKKKKKNCSKIILVLSILKFYFPLIQCLSVGRSEFSQSDHFCQKFFKKINHRITLKKNNLYKRQKFFKKINHRITLKR